MTTFTKGPWQIIGSNVHDGFDYFEIKAQPSPALRGFTKTIASVDGPQNGAESKANAHLISASPELLEALEVIINLHFSADYVEPDSMNRAMRAGRAALSKARGVKEG